MLVRQTAETASKVLRCACFVFLLLFAWNQPAWLSSWVIGGLPSTLLLAMLSVELSIVSFHCLFCSNVVCFPLRRSTTLVYFHFLFIYVFICSRVFRFLKSNINVSGLVACFGCAFRIQCDYQAILRCVLSSLLHCNAVYLRSVVVLWPQSFLYLSEKKIPGKGNLHTVC